MFLGPRAAILWLPDIAVEFRFFRPGWVLKPRWLWYKRVFMGERTLSEPVWVLPLRPVGASSFMERLVIIRPPR